MDLLSEDMDICDMYSQQTITYIYNYTLSHVLAKKKWNSIGCENKEIQEELISTGKSVKVSSSTSYLKHEESEKTNKQTKNKVSIFVYRNRVNKRDAGLWDS